jgi:flagellar biogenesis protein FliO
MFEILVSPEVLAVTRSPLISLGYIFQLIISFAIVIGLIYFSAKYILPKMQLPAGERTIEITDRIGLEPQVTSYIISAKGKSYLIVVSNKGVTLIDKLEDEKKT